MSNPKLTLIKSITFLSAFLMFQIELIIGKIFLPNFGGSFVVWGACVVFFQAALLLGYMYSHCVVQKIGIYKYRYIHLILLGLPFLFFPGKPLAMRYEISTLPMVLEIFLKLIFTIGPAFFVLSTMSIIWQAWLSQSTIEERSNPYTLFAVSNFGSFAALLTYPFFIESYLDLFQQQHIWRWMYVGMFFLQALALFVVNVDKKLDSKREKVKKVSLSKGMPILIYGAAGVMIFLSVTSIITAEIVPMPLLWVLPLTLYLFSFVLIFKKKSWAPAWMVKRFDVLVGFAVLFYFFTQMKAFPILFELAVLLMITFWTCLYCQYQVFRLRPKDLRNLTSFYLYLALGGFLGGVLVTWFVPLFSTTFVEYFLSFFVIYLAGLKDKSLRLNKFYVARLCLYVLAILFVWPLVFKQYNFWGMILIIAVMSFAFKELARHRFGILSVLLILSSSLNVLEPIWNKQVDIYRDRNYYGISKISEEEGVRYFLHGATIHGAQFLNPKGLDIPLTYFSSTSPIGEVMQSDNFDFRKIGVIGLGVGTLATYLNDGEHLDFFELDPDVESLAKNYFSYLKNAKGKIQHFTGDARITLEKMPLQNYQLLVADAFSGDAVPVHLITEEAMHLYQKHLAPEGLVLFNITNRYINNQYPILSTALSTDAKLCYKVANFDSVVFFSSTWVAVTWNDEVYKTLTEEMGWLTVDKNLAKRVRKWNDRYTNILPYVKFKELGYALKNFDFLR